MSMSNVEALRRSVNTMTDIASEKIIRIDFEDIFLEFSTLLEPMIIGKSGNIQGASIVRIPANTAIPKNNMLINLT
jgi:hypothetical protein